MKRYNFSTSYTQSITGKICRAYFLYSVITFLMIPLSINSRPDSPCNCSSFTPIGITDQNTNITALGSQLASNTCYLIKGTLTINTSTNWSQVRLKMEEKSQILVTTELRITDSYISGCDAMWKGIKTNTTTNLSISGTAIESAEFAIYLSSYSGFFCVDNDFINDYIGIAIGSPFEADQFDQHILQKGQITGCSFYTSTNLPDPYPGQEYDPSWPTTPTEIPYDQGFAAIFMSGTTGFNIGAKGALTTARNEVYQMRNGIIMRNSVSEIYGTDFYDFEGNIAYAPEDPLLDINQNAFNAFRSWVHIEDNTIDNIMVGIYTLESFMKVHDNILNIPTGAIIAYI